MKAATVKEVGATPVFGEFSEPVPQNGEVLVTVKAAALSHFTKGRASGRHYSAHGMLPFVAGADGVGQLSDGKRVYFVLPRHPFGSMAEKSVVRAAQCVPVPDGLDDVTAAAIANPGMSSWAAFTKRARLLPGETVLVNGATGTTGRLAVQIAKRLGAKKVIATGRDAETLQLLPSLGADVTISLSQPAETLEELFEGHFGDGVDVVLDYLWGSSAELLIVAGAKGGKETVPIRYVEVGSVSGQSVNLPGAALRSSALQLMGSGIGSVPVEDLLAAVGDLFQAAAQGGLRVETRVVSLAEVENAWSGNNARSRTVFVVGSIASGPG
jgi:NADPH:quinone reductase-like Zn-dependent oxidoreductase